MESAEKLVERKDEQKQGINLPRTTFITCIGQVTKHGVPTCLQLKTQEHLQIFFLSFFQNRICKMYFLLLY